jgi:hypothetical protein
MRGITTVFNLPVLLLLALMASCAAAAPNPTYNPYKQNVADEKGPSHLSSSYLECLSSQNSLSFPSLFLAAVGTDKRHAALPHLG